MDTHGTYIIDYNSMVLIGTVSGWHDLKQTRKIEDDQKVVADVDEILFTVPLTANATRTINHHYWRFLMMFVGSPSFGNPLV